MGLGRSVFTSIVYQDVEVAILRGDLLIGVFDRGIILDVYDESLERARGLGVLCLNLLDSILRFLS